MIVVDANLLLYAYDVDSAFYIASRKHLEGHAAGRLVTDAGIAAMTIEYGGELHTNDRGFARFPGLRWKNPLAKA